MCSKATDDLKKYLLFRLINNKRSGNYYVRFWTFKYLTNFVDKRGSSGRNVLVVCIYTQRCKKTMRCFVERHTYEYISCLRLPWCSRMLVGWLRVHALPSLCHGCSLTEDKLQCCIWTALSSLPLRISLETFNSW